MALSVLHIYLQIITILIYSANSMSDENTPGRSIGNAIFDEINNVKGSACAVKLLQPDDDTWKMLETNVTSLCYAPFVDPRVETSDDRELLCAGLFNLTSKVCASNVSATIELQQQYRNFMSSSITTSSDICNEFRKFISLKNVKTIVNNVFSELIKRESCYDGCYGIGRPHVNPISVCLMIYGNFLLASQEKTTNQLVPRGSTVIDTQSQSAHETEITKHTVPSVQLNGNSNTLKTSSETVKDAVTTVLSEDTINSGEEEITNQREPSDQIKPQTFTSPDQEKSPFSSTKVQSEIGKEQVGTNTEATNQENPVSQSTISSKIPVSQTTMNSKIPVLPSETNSKTSVSQSSLNSKSPVDHKEETSLPDMDEPTDDEESIPDVGSKGEKGTSDLQATDEKKIPSLKVNSEKVQEENEREDFASLGHNGYQESIPVVSIDINDSADTHFLAYFLTFTFLCIIGYLVFHNKQKIIALVIEGRKGRGGRRRTSSAVYHRLDNNLEEAMTSSAYKDSVTNIIY